MCVCVCVCVCKADSCSKSGLYLDIIESDVVPIGPAFLIVFCCNSMHGDTEKEEVQIKCFAPECYN